MPLCGGVDRLGVRVRDRALGARAFSVGFLVRSAAGSYTGHMADAHGPDPREELRRRLAAGEVPPSAADLALSALDPAGDAAALDAAEQRGTLSAEASARVVDSWGLDAEISEMMARLGLETSAR